MISHQASLFYDITLIFGKSTRSGGRVYFTKVGKVFISITKGEVCGHFTYHGKDFRLVLCLFFFILTVHTLNDIRLNFCTY